MLCCHCGNFCTMVRPEPFGGSFLCFWHSTHNTTTQKDNMDQSQGWNFRWHCGTFCTIVRPKRFVGFIFMFLTQCTCHANPKRQDGSKSKMTFPLSLWQFLHNGQFVMQFHVFLCELKHPCVGFTCLGAPFLLTIAQKEPQWQQKFHPWPQSILSFWVGMLFCTERAYQPKKTR